MTLLLFPINLEIKGRQGRKGRSEQEVLKRTYISSRVSCSWWIWELTKSGHQGLAKFVEVQHTLEQQIVWWQTPCKSVVAAVGKHNRITCSPPLRGLSELAPRDHWCIRMTFHFCWPHIPVGLLTVASAGQRVTVNCVMKQVNVPCKQLSGINTNSKIILITKT